MAGNGEAEAAKFTADRRAAVGWLGRKWTGIQVCVHNVTGRDVVSAAGVIHQPRWIKPLHPLRQPWCVVLPPPFVENNPHHNRRMVPKAFNHRLEFCLKLFVACGGDSNAIGHFAGLFVATGAAANSPRTRAGAGHVLPNEQAKFVAPVIPAIWLNLDVLACHVHAKLFCHLNVVAKRSIRRRCVDAVRPVALVEKASLKNNLVVQQNPGYPLVVFAHRNRAHAKVAVHYVAAIFNAQIVEKWLLW